MTVISFQNGLLYSLEFGLLFYNIESLENWEEQNAP